MICEKCKHMVNRDTQTYCQANGREIRIPSVHELGTWGVTEAKTCACFQPSISEMSQSQFVSDNYCIEEDLAESYAREKRLEEKLDILRRCFEKCQDSKTMDHATAMRTLWQTVETILREDLQ